MRVLTVPKSMARSLTKRLLILFPIISTSEGAQLSWFPWRLLAVVGQRAHCARWPILFLGHRIVHRYALGLELKHRAGFDPDVLCPPRSAEQIPAEAHRQIID